MVFEYCIKVNALSRWLSGKESACQCWSQKRYSLDPWVRKIPWSWKWQRTPVFSPETIPWTEEPGGLQSTGLQRVTHAGAHIQWFVECMNEHTQIKAGSRWGSREGREGATVQGLAKSQTRPCSHRRQISICEFQYCLKTRTFSLILYVFEMDCHE